MSHDRFENLLSTLHHADNTAAVLEGQLGSDKSKKTQSFIKMLRKGENFQKYEPNQDPSSDEAVCPFKGRVKFHVYIPDNPNKFGIKILQSGESANRYYIASVLMCIMDQLTILRT